MLAQSRDRRLTSPPHEGAHPRRWLAAAALLALLPSCFAARATSGQLALVNDQRPLAQALEAERDPERRRMLSSVGGIRAFARDVLQLRPSRSYSGYFETDAPGLTFVVVACERTRFEPYTWWFPVAGTVAYKSHFDEASAEAEAEELRAQGYDTWVGRSRAYSTLGIFRDPLVTTMMRGGFLEFVEIVIHELTHARFYVPGQTDFNEQLASFVATKGTQQLLASDRHRQTGLLQRYHLLIERRDAFETQVAGAITELEVLYASGKSRADILRQRQPIFDRLSQGLERLASARHGEPDPRRLVMNNARLLQWRRYGQKAVYLQALWTKSGASWPRFWQLVEVYGREELEGTTDDSDAD